jgi:hypothetical protein
MIFEVNYIYEDGWQGAVSRTEVWEANTKEEFFEEVYKKNCSLQKKYSGNRHSYEPREYALQDEYDEWWVNTPEDKKQRIMLTA